MTPSGSDGHENASRRLAVYGTLAPGRPNEHALAGLQGTWTTGIVHGHLHRRGWGAASGFPGIVLDDAGPEVEVHVLTSADLPAHWDRLDAFEGPGYRRTVVRVTEDGHEGLAQIYALADDETSPGGLSDPGRR